MSCTRGCCPTPADHWRTVSVSAHATPTRRPDVVRIDNADARLDRDSTAYRTLRRQGFQPRDIDGCDRLAATARDVHDIEGTPRPSPMLEDF